MDQSEKGGCITMSDSDWAGGEAGGRRSLSGMVTWVRITGMMWPIHNGFRRQAIVALPSAEAELAGLVLAASEGMGVLSLARSMLGHKSASSEADKTLFILAGDSSAAIAMASEVHRVIVYISRQCCFRE